ncbi:MAG: class I SAM-dependent methyltransferase [Planctomycetota bacterium]
MCTSDSARDAAGASERGQREIRAFRDEYPGGYLEGDPLDPLARSSFLDGGYLSVLHACYLVCIKPYVGPQTRVLELGPGRGAWTRCFVECGAREICCVDAITAEKNRFWDYVGQRPNVRYLVVEDFTLRDVPDGHFDYFFAFGVLCHISPPFVHEYLRNLHRKLRPGANGFALIADYEKYNRFLEQGRQYSVARALRDCFGGPAVEDFLRDNQGTHFQARYRRSLVEDDQIDPNRWYHLGVARAAELLGSAGFTVVSPDVGVLHRDPVVHFRK